MGIKLSNNAFGTLAAGINSSATSITLATGQGARFPTLSAGDYFYATLIDTSNNVEIVKCTARSTDVLTVTRAQESTTARSYSTGDRLEIRLTAATFEDATGVEDGEVTAAKLASGAVVTHLGYTPLNKAGDTMTGNLTISKVNPVINLKDTADEGVDVALGAFGENFYIFEPEDNSGTLTPDNAAKQWLRIEDDADAYIMGTRRVWDSGSAPGAVIQVVENRITSMPTYTNSDGVPLSQSITKKYAASKILLFVSYAWDSDNPNGAWVIERSYDNPSWTSLYRIAGIDETDNPNSSENVFRYAAQLVDTNSSSYSTIYYRLKWFHLIQNGGMMRFNSSYTQATMNPSGSPNQSSLTLLEVAA